MAFIRKTSARVSLAGLIRFTAQKLSKELFIVASPFAKVPYESV